MTEQTPDEHQWPVYYADALAVVPLPQTKTIAIGVVIDREARLGLIADPIVMRAMHTQLGKVLDRLEKGMH